MLLCCDFLFSKNKKPYNNNNNKKKFHFPKKKAPKKNPKNPKKTHTNLNLAYGTEPGIAGGGGASCCCTLCNEWSSIMKWTENPKENKRKTNTLNLNPKP